MASHAPDPPSKYGNARFVVDVADLQAARDLGLVRASTTVSCNDSPVPDYGVAYGRQHNIAEHEVSSQKPARAGVKDFAVRCGFQIFVKLTSVKPDNSGNAKYQCKKLNGAQFLDQDTPFEKLECPFFVNLFGFNGKWKITNMNFSHNHAKHVGFARVPFIEGSIPRPTTVLRNTTQELQRMTTLVISEILQMHNRTTTTLTGATIHEFLLSKGFDVGRSIISRMKLDIEDRLRGDMLESYQKLQAYFEIMVNKNPGSIWRLDKEDDDLTFRRALFIANIGIHAVQKCKGLVGFDGAHLKGDMNKRCVFLAVTTKDYNNHVVPFALGIVAVENYENWRWFMSCVKLATQLEKFTVVSDRQKGLLSAVSEIFPLAGHRFCLRHIMDNINRSGAILSVDDRRVICQMARSDCENDYKLFRIELAESKPDAAEYLDKIDKSHWVKYSFQEEFHLPTFNEITSNLSDQANNWIGNELCSGKALDAFQMYFTKLSELAAEMRKMAANWIAARDVDSLVPILQKQLKIAVRPPECAP